MSELQTITAAPTPLIPIHKIDGEDRVYGRDLHEFLEVSTEYRHWFARMLEYGFTEGVEYAVIFDRVVRDGRGAVERKDHALTIDMAKQLGMIQRTDRGRQVREYFIAVEKWAASQAAPSAPRELSRLELIELARESELARMEAEQHALAEGARADLAQKLLDEVERKDGLVVRDWIGKYFRPHQENRIWALFYSQRLLKNGLGLGGVDKHGKPKKSRDHQKVLTKGFSFFIRTKTEEEYGGKQRYETKVRPGRAELELVEFCERHGILPLLEVSQALFEIRENGTMIALGAAA
ncbi:antA/AntB antirepressor family protein [Leucobacter allii]|uniref:AntA/AntB antirepressor family protein n=1 Tax=Leucobacter allii TaxID=2932247 RepID=A0ABY4FI28_9MICO|nr:antA/AntB antirepressor family protein [Leucobacter allii]UOQ56045.1 antA/AntB antirepressor family protein [Leucobacter allii]